MSDHPITFRFDVQKAAQAANKLLRLTGGERNYMELVKLLYLADRRALLQFELPITGDCFTALPHGPALSHILELIRWGPVDEKDAPWFAAVSPLFGYTLKALPGCEEDELSDAEGRILAEVFEEFGRLNWKDLSRMTRALPEWVNPAGEQTPISAEQILLVEGRSREEIERIRSEAAAYERLDQESESYRNETGLAARPSCSGPPQPLGPLKDFLHDQELNYLNFALAQTDGDKEKAAQLLGISVATLYRKLGGEEVEA